jgi:hypothetical protein
MNSCFAPTENTRGHLRRLSLRPDRANAPFSIRRRAHFRIDLGDVDAVIY